MKMYLMSCGRLRSRKSIYVPVADENEYVDSPMPVFLITHPRGNVLFDTGPNPEMFEDAKAVLGGLAKVFQPVGDWESGVVFQLKKTGLTPDDVQYVVNSHLHFDHAGGNRFFPKATFIVSSKEVECARRPELQGRGYSKRDWDLDLSYREVEGMYDVFDDGRLVVLPLPGHTPGHQGLLVRLDNDGPFILPGDSVPFRENFEKRLLARTNLEDQQALATIDVLQDMVHKEKARLIYSHDADYWDTLNTAPQYYS